MKTKFTLFVTALAVTLFGVGCASLEDGLVGYYPFNGNAKNEMGEENDGEINGATFSKDRHGSMNESLLFDGEDDYLQIKDPIYSPDPVSHTISFWMKALKRGGEIISDRHGASCDYKYRIYFSGGVAAKEGGPALAWTIFEERVNQKDLFFLRAPMDEWIFISCTYDLETGMMTNYLNGGKVSERQHFKAWSNLPNTTTIGTLFGCAKYGARQPEGYFKGSVDDVRFYNRALSDSEVKALYDLEKPKTK